MPQLECTQKNNFLNVVVRIGLKAFCFPAFIKGSCCLPSPSLCLVWLAGWQWLTKLTRLLSVLTVPSTTVHIQGHQPPQFLVPSTGKAEHLGSSSTPEWSFVISITSRRGSRLSLVGKQGISAAGTPSVVTLVLESPLPCEPNASLLFGSGWAQSGVPWKTGSPRARHCFVVWSPSPVWLFCDSMDCSLPGSSVRGILQARILEWVAISFSRGSSQPRDWTHVSSITGRFFTGQRGGGG